MVLIGILRRTKGVRLRMTLMDRTWWRCEVNEKQKEEYVEKLGDCLSTGCFTGLALVLVVVTLLLLSGCDVAHDPVRLGK